MKQGDSVTLITGDQGELEVDHYTIIDKLEVGKNYSVTAEDNGWVMLDGYKHWHYGEKFKVVSPHQFPASIDEHGVLRVDMVDIRDFCKSYPGKKVKIIIEIDEESH